MPKETKKTKQNQSLVVVTIDGWGLAPLLAANVFNAEVAPNLSAWLASYPSAQLAAAPALFAWSRDRRVTREAGHLALDLGDAQLAGRLVDERLGDEEVIFKDKQLLLAIKQAKRYDSAWQMLVSVNDLGEVDNSEYLSAICELAKRKKLARLYIRPIASQSGLLVSRQLIDLAKTYPELVITKSIDPALALDQSYDWQKTESAYKAVVDGEQSLKDNDVVIILATNSGASFQLVRSLVENDFNKFERVTRSGVLYLSVNKFPEYLRVKTIASRPQHVGYSSILAKNNLKQIVVTESYGALAALYYGSGLVNRPLAKGEWHLVNSPTWSQAVNQPEAVSAEIIDEANGLINAKEYDLIKVVLPALDLAAGFGSMEVMTECLATLDKLLVKLVKVALENDCLIFITSTCARPELVLDPLGGEKNYHGTNGRLPFIVIGRELEGHSFGALNTGLADLEEVLVEASIEDIAPSILKHFALEQPKSMPGKSLI